MEELAVFVGRQPIFDRTGNIFGYELLYRNSEDNVFPQGMNAEKATIDLLVNTFLTIGIDRLVGRTKSFINFSQLSLKSDIVEQLDPRFVIIELLEDVKITEEVIHSITRLRKRGFKIALDDFTLQQVKQDELLPLLFKKVNIIKVDFLATQPHERRQIEMLAKKYSNVTLLAEKIETQADHIEAKRNGYLLFQGYYFARPQVIKGKEIPANYLLHFQLIKEFNEEVPNVEKITELFMRDVSLSYKLLRYINSLTFDIPHQISSINQAIMLMGLTEAKRWLRILLLRDLGIGEGRGQKKALIERSLVRAKLIELIAKHKRRANSDEYFLAGLFSLIDMIMQSDLEEVIPQLSLSEVITETLLGKDTEIQPYLQLAIGLETFEMENLDEYVQTLNIEERTLIKFVREAHKWATIFD